MSKQADLFYRKNATNQCLTILNRKPLKKKEINEIFEYIKSLLRTVHESVNSRLGIKKPDPKAKSKKTIPGTSYQHAGEVLVNLGRDLITRSKKIQTEAKRQATKEQHKLAKEAKNPALSTAEKDFLLSEANNKSKIPSFKATPWHKARDPENLLSETLSDPRLKGRLSLIDAFKAILNKDTETDEFIYHSLVWQGIANQIIYKSFPDRFNRLGTTNELWKSSFKNMNQRLKRRILGLSRSQPLSTKIDLAQRKKELVQIFLSAISK